MRRFDQVKTLEADEMLRLLLSIPDKVYGRSLS